MVYYSLVAGTWESTPGKWHACTDRDECRYLIFGHLRPTDADGRTETFKTDDSFPIPNDSGGTREVVETPREHDLSWTTASSTADRHQSGSPSRCSRKAKASV